MNCLRQQQQGCPEHVGIPPRSWWMELGEGRLGPPPRQGCYPSDQIQISIWKMKTTDKLGPTFLNVIPLSDPNMWMIQGVGFHN